MGEGKPECSQEAALCELFWKERDLNLQGSNAVLRLIFMPYINDLFKEVIFIFIYLFVCLFRATPVAYGGFQARDRIRAIAAGLHCSHSNARSEPHLQPTPPLMAMPDP